MLESKQLIPPASLLSSSTYVHTARLERWSRTAQSNYTQSYVAHFWKIHHKLLLGNWNVLTITRRELELVEEVKKYHLIIVGVSFIKRCGSRIIDLDGK